MGRWPGNPKLWGVAWVYVGYMGRHHCLGGAQVLRQHCACVRALDRDAGRDAGIGATFWISLDGTADHRLAPRDGLNAAVQHTARIRLKIRPDRAGAAEDRLTPLSMPAFIA